MQAQPQSQPQPQPQPYPGQLPVQYNPYGSPAAWNPRGYPYGYARGGLLHNVRMLRHNPEGMAAGGALIGNLIGTAAAWLIAAAIWKKPPTSADVIVADATAQEAALTVNAEQQRMLDELAAWNRKRHAVSAALATLGAALGAYVGAAPYQANRAAIGAVIGTGAVRSVNVIFNPVIGLPGWIAGAAGAFIGARGAMARAA